MLDEVKIAIDAMGSDNGPESIISGASLSKDRYPNIYFLFFGKKEQLEKIIKKYKNLNHSYEIINCDEVILPNDKPSAVIRKRKKTSMGCSIEYLSNSTKIFLNGGWIGCTHNPLKIVNIMKLHRRNGMIDIYTSISFNYKRNE